jgi:hypothetical protein
MTWCYSDRFCNRRTVDRSALKPQRRCAPPDKFPTNFDYDVASECASAKIKDVSQKLALYLWRRRRCCYLPTMRSTSTGRCCASLANRRSGSTSRLQATTPYSKGSKLTHVAGVCAVTTDAFHASFCLAVSNARVALPNFYNIAIRIANVAARLAVLGLRLRDELGPSTSP